MSAVQPRFFLVLGLIATGLALGIWLLLSSGNSTAQATTTPVAAASLPGVVTARAAVGAGQILQPDDLAEVQWTNGRPPATAIIAGSAQAKALVGAVTRRTLAAGEMLVPGAVIAPGERGFLAALVTPGFRAIAVSVDASTAAGGLIWPGDRVDVVMTQEIKADGVSLGQRVVSETILTDARVLSTDQTLQQATEAKDPKAEVVEGPRSVPATVTLEVLPEAAERLTVASTLGQLHLTLRGVAAESADWSDSFGRTRDATWAGAVSPALATVVIDKPQSTSAGAVAPQPEAAPGVRIYRGSDGGK